MYLLFFLLLLIVILAAAGSVLAGAATLLWYVLLGLVIGALARLLVKDTEHVSMAATILAGIAGVLGGGVLASLLDVGGFMEFLLEVIVAAVAIFITVGVARNTAARRPIA